MLSYVQNSLGFLTMLLATVTVFSAGSFTVDYNHLIEIMDLSILLLIYVHDAFFDLNIPLVGRTQWNPLSIVSVLLLSKPVLRVHYIVYCI